MGMRALPVWISIIVLYTLLALYLVPKSYHLTRQSGKDPQQLVDEVKDQLLRHPPLGTFTIWDHVAWELDDTLFTGTAFYPSSQLSPLYHQFLHLDCDQRYPGTLNMEEKKTLQWLNYKCQSIPQLINSSLPVSPFINMAFQYKHFPERTDNMQASTCTTITPRIPCIVQFFPRKYFG